MHQGNDSVGYFYHVFCDFSALYMNGFDLLTFVAWWVASVSGTAARQQVV
jgi:hypothetical protein